MSKSPAKTISKNMKIQVLSPTNQNSSPKKNPYIPPSLVSDKSRNFSEKINDQIVLKQDKVVNKSYTILQHLDQQDKRFAHKYKQFKIHSKKSGVQQTKDIIRQLLDKHSYDRELTTSEQYILAGYLAQYIQFAKQSQRMMRNPFNINRRIQTQNGPGIGLQCPLSPSKCLSPRKKAGTSFSKHQKSKQQERKQQLSKQFMKLKFMWQIYQLKTIVCVNLNRFTEQEESKNHKEMLQIMGKLKEIERNRVKLGEQKMLSEVSKIMLRFQTKIKQFLC